MSTSIRDFGISIWHADSGPRRRASWRSRPIGRDEGEDPVEVRAVENRPQQASGRFGRPVSLFGAERSGRGSPPAYRGRSPPNCHNVYCCDMLYIIRTALMGPKEWDRADDRVML